MAGHDRTKWDLIFKMNVVEFLNTMGFYKETADFERQQIKAWKKQSN
jgi:hypothetical protein